MTVTHPVTDRGESVTECVLLKGVTWETYEALLEEVENRRIRLTYDRGALEIMTPSNQHLTYNHIIGRLIDAMTEELGIRIRGGRSMTFKHVLLEKGLEPDACSWIENEARVRGVFRDLDITKDPPPDLGIEVELSRSALDRMGIYAALGVREIWRWTKTRQLTHHHLEGKSSLEISQSRCFPFLLPEDLPRFILSYGNEDETTWIQGFRTWVRTELKPRRDAQKPGTPGL